MKRVIVTAEAAELVSPLLGERILGLVADRTSPFVSMAAVALYRHQVDGPSAVMAIAGLEPEFQTLLVEALRSLADDIAQGIQTEPTLTTNARGVA